MIRIRAGSLDRRVTIQRKVTSLSASGAALETWSNIAVRRAASAWPVRGDETMSGPERVASDQMEFRIRYSRDVADLTPLDRIVYPALTEQQAADPDFAVPTRSIFDILQVSEMDRREGLKIVAERRADVTE